MCTICFDRIEDLEMMLKRGKSKRAIVDTMGTF